MSCRYSSPKPSSHHRVGESSGQSKSAPATNCRKPLCVRCFQEEFGSANRTAVISSRYRSLHMSHVPVFARARVTCARIPHLVEFSLSGSTISGCAMRLGRGRPSAEGSRHRPVQPQGPRKWLRVGLSLTTGSAQRRRVGPVLVSRRSRWPSCSISTVARGRCLVSSSRCLEPLTGFAIELRLADAPIRRIATVQTAADDDKRWFLLRRLPFECRRARMPSVRQSVLSTWLCASNTARRASISTSSRLRR
jgi:hypothetical protein